LLCWLLALSIHASAAERVDEITELLEPVGELRLNLDCERSTDRELKQCTKAWKTLKKAVSKHAGQVAEALATPGHPAFSSDWEGRQRRSAALRFLVEVMTALDDCGWSPISDTPRSLRWGAVAQPLRCGSLSPPMLVAQARR
jgi:hypothetical protein